MEDKKASPIVDLLRVRIYGPDQQELWCNEARAVPCVGDDVLLFNESKTIIHSAPVQSVVWGMHEHVAGQIVVVQLGDKTMQPNTVEAFPNLRAATEKDVALALDGAPFDHPQTLADLLEFHNRMLDVLEVPDAHGDVYDLEG